MKQEMIIKQYKEEIQEVRKLNEQLQIHVIDGQKKITDIIKLINSKKDTIVSEEIDHDSVQIGTESDDHNTIYIGYGRWIEKESYKTAMDARRATLFINTMALYIFGSDTLMKSTKTGASSRRTKDVPDDVEKPLKLPHDGIMILRGIFKHFLNTSLWYKDLDSLSKDSLAGKLKEFLTRFISNMKAPKSRPVKKDANTAKKLKNDSEDENDEKNEKKDDEIHVSEDDNNDNHPQHIYPKIIINKGGHENNNDIVSDSTEVDDEIHDGTIDNAIDEEEDENNNENVDINDVVNDKMLLSDSDEDD
ncbi:uncharacterized protein LOC141526545 [Cotesia typhae]|uniref:uncharacterized protein LOC141526545 n=1 Tax=Cotesia typhae TaxID=2053667 RepID=UPI003D694DF0